MPVHEIETDWFKYQIEGRLRVPAFVAAGSAAGKRGEELWDLIGLAEGRLSRFPVLGLPTLLSPWLHPGGDATRGQA